jgi:acetoin utilization deacetylase AcuC-like enzyme
VTRATFGGSCYLNNSAAAAARLRALGRVAVLDVDAHHGNGTQAIFARDPGVLTGSVHVDPAAGWFPHFAGFADESDGGNRNLPVAPGTGDDGWLAAIGELVEWAGGADALVVALGVDAAGGDPESPLDVSERGFRAAGRALGAMRLPTVVVQEGGYELETIGRLVRAALEGIEEVRDVGRDR